MTPLFWTTIAALIIILLYPAGFLAGFAKGRNTKVLTVLSNYLNREDDDAAGDRETP